jgi:glycosyltransferase involved in cell wall biosynthesis
MIDSRIVDAKSNAEIPICLGVVIPVYNEQNTVAEVLRTVLAQHPVQEVIVVDDASTDDSLKILEDLAKNNPRVKIYRHEKNQGKGAALRLGFAHCTAPIVMVQDADLEYDPAEYFLLLKPILANKADVVYGSRFAGSGSRRVLYFWHAVGNRLLTLLSNMATNLNLSDMETCYKVFRREIIQKLTIQESRFGFEPEMTAKVSRLKVRVYEVAVSYYGRTYGEGKKIGWRDGLSALRCIVKYNFFT